MDYKNIAEDSFKQVLKSVNPKDFLPELVHWNPKIRTLTIGERTFILKKDQEIFLTGTGKASATMASAIESVLGNSLSGGFVIAPPGSALNSQKVSLEIGSHPLPDSNSFNASRKLLDYCRQIPESSLVINVLSGGTSSLFSVPVDTIDGQDLRTIFERLIQSGASIQEINTVRKVFSKVKGGQFLSYFKHTTLVDLIISDVPDDDKRFIGSGPTTAQEISAIKAHDVLRAYKLLDKIPQNAYQYLNDEVKQERDSSTTRKTKDFEGHVSMIVSSASQVAKKTTDILQRYDYQVHLADKAWSGPIDDFEELIFQKLDELLNNDSPKQAALFYGECTVQVEGDGLGGRNQELALRISKKLDSYDTNITFLSAGTDGIDGPTDAAGAVVNQNTWKQAVDMNLNPKRYLSENDSYHFFKKAGGHIVTGPTGNNVMDIQILLVDQ